MHWILGIIFWTYMALWKAPFASILTVSVIGFVLLLWHLIAVKKKNDRRRISETHFPRTRK